MNPESLQETQCYTWNGHGNLGDDWIGEVSSQYFASVMPVREKRSLNPIRLGQHRLRRDDGRAAKGQLVLWGGGWIASDRPGSRTIPAWARHFRSQIEQASGIGLGIGPFADTGVDQQSTTNAFFETLRGRLSVRTFSDLKHLPPGHTAVVGCDVALLDQRFLATNRYSGHESNYVVFSFPAYSNHWQATRPWMTETWYLAQVGALADQVGQSHRIVFVEFDQMVGLTSDSAYWSHVTGIVARPKSIEDAADLFRKARKVYAGRLHAAILGAVLGSPTLALAYHHKFEVVSELGIPTLGLFEEPMATVEPKGADRNALNHVRQRGVEALEAVRLS